jgi:uncharacterized protein (TIGR03083 family)
VSLPLDAVRPAVGREWRRFRELLVSAGENAWSAPTRLSGWAVRDLAAHAVWGVSMEADALRRRRTGAAGRADGRTVGEGASPAAIVVELDAARLELGDELDRLTEDDLASVAPLPYGDVPLAAFSQILVMEAGVHTSDLGAALGQPDELAPDVVVATDVFLRLFLPVVAASAQERPEPGTAIRLRGKTVDLGFRFAEGGWEASVNAEPGATVSGDDSTVLLFAMGRVPVTDARLSISGDEAIAHRFKAWLPGP